MSKPEEKLKLTSLIAVIAVDVGLVLVSWGWAHQTVATECERLGSFYVGSKVFECKEKSK